MKTNQTTDTLRHNIARLLVVHKLTQAQIAEQLGHHRSWLSRFLRYGFPCIPVSELDDLALALGVHVYALFQSPEEQAENPINRFLPFSPGERRPEVHPRNPKGQGHKDRGSFSRIPRKTTISLAAALQKRAERKRKLAQERYRKKKQAALLKPKA